MPNITPIDKSTLTRFTRIDQLKGDNWLPWKTRVTALFAIADLIKYIDGSYLRPSDESLIKEWDTRDLQTRSLLQLTVGDEELIHLSGTQTVAEMWKQLRNTKEPKGIFGVVAER
jgi:hypothetical protein